MPIWSYSGQCSFQSTILLLQWSSLHSCSSLWISQPSVLFIAPLDACHKVASFLKRVCACECVCVWRICVCVHVCVCVRALACTQVSIEAIEARIGDWVLWSWSYLHFWVIWYECWDLKFCLCGWTISALNDKAISPTPCSCMLIWSSTLLLLSCRLSSVRQRA